MSPPGSPELFFAFADGAITFDCAPCGRCCKSVGTGIDRAQLETSEDLQRMLVFLDPAGTTRPLVSVFTFADGCRQLTPDNLCDLHRRGGPQAKPRICRLFPFSRLVDLDGMWTLLPQGHCPWVGSAAPAAFSRHSALLEELAGAGSETGSRSWPEWFVPVPLPVVTRLPSLTRRQLETTV